MSGAWAAGAAAISAAGSYYGAKKSAEARKEAAKTANKPFQAKKPYLTDLYERASQAADVPDYQQTVMGEDSKVPDALQQGFTMTRELSDQLAGQGYGQNVSGYGQDLLAGKYLDPETNEGLQKSMDAVRQETTENLQRDILPDLTGQAAQAGQMGSSRQGVVQANAVDDTQQNIANELARMQLQAYEAERQRQMQAPNIISQGTEMQMTPAQLQEQAGRGIMDIGDQVDPMTRLAQYGQVLGAGPNEKRAAKPGPMPMQSAISGGLGGLSMYGSYQQATQGQGGGQQQGAYNTSYGRGPGGYSRSSF